MKHLLLTLTLFTLFSFSGTNPVKEVYICVSPGAVAYHYDDDCRGLNRCKHEVRKVTLDEAVKKYKLRLCGYED